MVSIMLVIKTHYCLPFHKAVIVCLIAVTFGINLFVGLIPLQNSFAQDFDTNGDGVVDALDDSSASATSSTDEIQMDTNGDGVVDELDTATTTADTTTTGVEETTNTPENIVPTENQVTTGETSQKIVKILLNWIVVQSLQMEEKQQQHQQQQE